jgi:hypothetical protein
MIPFAGAGLRLGRLCNQVTNLDVERVLSRARLGWCLYRHQRIDGARAPVHSAIDAIERTGPSSTS